MRLSDKQVAMLNAFHEDLEATDICDFDGPLGWHNRERVIIALERKGLIDRYCKLTTNGRLMIGKLALLGRL